MKVWHAEPGSGMRAGIAAPIVSASAVRGRLGLRCLVR